MKHYKPVSSSRHYTDKRHFVFSRRKSRVPSHQEISGYDDGDDFATCSSYDCTGLIPAAVQDQAEADAYEDIYPYITPPAPPKDNQTN